MILESISSAGFEPSNIAYRMPDGSISIVQGGRALVPDDVAEYLTSVRRGLYDHKATEILAFASSWAYSDVSTFALAMAQRGLYGNDCVAITFSNDALLVDTSALLLQSESRRLAILCFRGTEPRNVIDWVSDTSGKMESFLSAGKVHGGFHRAARSIWPVLRPLLRAAAEERSICDELQSMKKKWMKSCSASGYYVEDWLFPGRAPGETETPEVRATGRGGGAPGEPGTVKREPPALYITGHSLGGALAVLTAALIDWDDDFNDEFPGLIRGIYTYGQPMVGDATFARECRGNIGNYLYRHVYDKDIVPRLPSLTMGNFEHFGREYRSTNEGWTLRTRPAQRVLTLGLSNVIGALAWLTHDVLPLKGLRLPLSWGHHSPLNYMRTSMIARPGAEFDPSVPVPRRGR
ncbi:lipase family protein [Sorangium sp. So ce1335]|uniref:lipase family protein n=1 Tax=Sorangium sp. So ce1335 TaxID=3133335 RepID=UPI003F62B16B